MADARPVIAIGAANELVKGLHNALDKVNSIHRLLFTLLIITQTLNVLFVLKLGFVSAQNRKKASYLKDQ